MCCLIASTIQIGKLCSFVHRFSFTRHCHLSHTICCILTVNMVDTMRDKHYIITASGHFLAFGERYMLKAVNLPLL